MKTINKLSILIFFISSPIVVFSQFKTAISKDQLIFDIKSDFWSSIPGNGTKQQYFSPGANLSVMKSIELDSAQLTIAFGVGISNHNLRSNMQFNYNPISDQVHIVAIPDSVNYTSNKLTTTFVDIPLELRYKTKANKKNNSFKITVGAKVGYLLNSHIKYNGENLATGVQEKVKRYNIENINALRFGLLSRIGFGDFSLFGCYSFTPFFELDKGYETTPLEFGISFSPF